MDFVKETTAQALHIPTSYLNTSDEVERKPCVHGTPCMVNTDGSLCLWECSECESAREEQERKAIEPARRRSEYYAKMNPVWMDFRKIPKRFEGKTINEFKAQNKGQDAAKKICINYVKNWPIVQENGTSMVFCGKPGTGKTHLCFAIVSALQKQMITAALVTAADMTSAVKSTYASDIKAADVVQSFSSLKLLVIDEVGVQVSTDAEKRIFFDIINKRYESVLPTILISNLAYEELGQFVGQRVLDRMNENSGVVMAFDWESYR